jgi:hypothetical protein
MKPKERLQIELNLIYKMDTKNIIESGFIKAFISEYYEYKIHSYYPDKDRLLYVMCNSEQEKDKITAKKIKQTRSKIKNLGNEELSFAYVLSCKPESLHSLIMKIISFRFSLLLKPLNYLKINYLFQSMKMNFGICTQPAKNQ